MHCASQWEHKFDTTPRNEADSAINVPEYTGKETDANDIADTAV